MKKPSKRSKKTSEMTNSVLFGSKAKHDYTVKKPITARRKKNPMLVQQQRTRVDPAAFNTSYQQETKSISDSLSHFKKNTSKLQKSPKKGHTKDSMSSLTNLI